MALIIRFQQVERSEGEEPKGETKEEPFDLQVRSDMKGSPHQQLGGLVFARWWERYDIKPGEVYREGGKEYKVLEVCDSA